MAPEPAAVRDFEQRNSAEEKSMRDIRGDLQERANLLDHQISAAQGQFEALIEQLNGEQHTRLEDLKTKLEALNRLIVIAVWQRKARAAAEAAAAAAVAGVSAAAAVAAACQFPYPQTD